MAQVSKIPVTRWSLGAGLPLADEEAWRSRLEAGIVERESKNPNVVAIYSEIEHLISTHDYRTLVASIVLKNPAVRTAAELIAGCVERRARPLFKRHEEA